jgi:hypothetical protein
MSLRVPTSAYASTAKAPANSRRVHGIAYPRKQSNMKAAASQLIDVAKREIVDVDDKPLALGIEVALGRRLLDRTLINADVLRPHADRDEVAGRLPDHSKAEQARRLHRALLFEQTA